MGKITIECLEKPKYCDKVHVLILPIKICNHSFCTNNNLKICISPVTKGTIIESFHQTIVGDGNKSFTIQDDVSCDWHNVFFFPVTLQGRSSCEGNLIIEFIDDSFCDTIQVVSARGKVLAELDVKAIQLEFIPLVDNLSN